MPSEKTLHAARNYVRALDPLDPDKGWQREDVQLGFVAGMEELGIRRLLTLPEAAAVLAVSVAVVRELVKFGELAFVHASRGTERKHLTFSVDEIESFIKRHTERRYYGPSPKTSRTRVRRSGAELAIERGLGSDPGGFMGKLPGRLAEIKQKKALAASARKSEKARAEGREKP
jgi:hypothetical protein